MNKIFQKIKKIRKNHMNNMFKTFNFTYNIKISEALGD